MVFNFRWWWNKTIQNERI